MSAPGESVRSMYVAAQTLLLNDPEVAFRDMMFISKFVKIGQFVQKLKGGTHTDSMRTS